MRNKYQIAIDKLKNDYKYDEENHLGTLQELVNLYTPKKCTQHTNNDLSQGKWCPTCGFHNLQDNHHCWSCGQMFATD